MCASCSQCEARGRRPKAIADLGGGGWWGICSSHATVGSGARTRRPIRAPRDPAGQALVAAVGAVPGPRLPGPGGPAALAEPVADRPAGQPGRIRVPGDRAGARARRGAVRFLLRDPVPERLPAAAGADLLVHQQFGDRVPRHHGGQRRGQRRPHAARLSGVPAPVPAPLGRVRRRGGRGRRAGRCLLHPVRAVRRDLPGRGPGVAALRAQLADREEHPRRLRRGSGARLCSPGTPMPFTRVVSSW